MDSGLIALLLSPVSVVLTALITQLVVRRNAKDATEVDRFEAILDGQDKRIKTLEAEVEELKTKRSADRAEITRLRQIVRAWAVELRAAWDQPHPMPLPPPDDMDFLGLTQDTPTRAETKEKP
jgi:hypothetical protein